MHSTNDLEDGYMGSGRRLRASIRKHGEDNHTKEILEFFDDRGRLIEAEKESITLDMIDDKDCMNLMGGGTGGFISEDQQRHRSTIAVEKREKKREDDPEWDKEYRQAQSLSLMKQYESGKRVSKLPNWEGRKHSEITKEKMRETKKGQGSGETNSQYGTCWITKDGSNKKIKKQLLDSFLTEGWVKGRK